MRMRYVSHPLLYCSQNKPPVSAAGSVKHFGKNKTGEPKANPKPLKTIKPPDIMAVVCDRIAEIKGGIIDEN